MQLQPGDDWVPARDLYRRVRGEVRDLGTGAYVRSNPVAVRVVSGRRPKQGRRQLNCHGVRRTAKVSLKSARSASEPWLLASSLGLRHLSAEAIVTLCRGGMKGNSR